MMFYLFVKLTTKKNISLMNMNMPMDGSNKKNRDSEQNEE